MVTVISNLIEFTQFGPFVGELSLLDTNDIISNSVKSQL